ncbi:MAG: DUF433 domain-containing protein [Candidatus Micrarchaeota archaeon]|nr:DUF433 domain-containing protein [Candidatus Micrarchaeota archaeon]
MTEITLNKNIRFGKPTIKGTRITVDDVLGALSGGMTFKEVEEEYAIKRTDILAVLKYAAKVISEEKIGLLTVSR